MMLTVADQRIRRGAAGTLRWTHLDGDGQATAAGGAVTVSVAKADGTSLVASRTASADADTTGLYTATLTATETATLDTLTVTWTDADDSATATTTVEIVDGFLFTIDEARAAHDSLAATHKNPVTTLDLIDLRLAVEQEAEWICGRAFTPRARRITLDGTGERRLFLPDPDLRAITAVSIDGTALTASELSALIVHEDRMIDRPDGYWWTQGVGNTIVAYTYGLSRAPHEVREAALLRLRDIANRPKSGIPLRATNYSVEGGTSYDLSKTSAHRTGIAEVDAVYSRWSTRVDGDDENAPASRMMHLDPQYHSLFHGGRQ